MSWRPDMTSWRHFVTCKTISGANQHIHLITNSFPEFYYTGRSMSHFTTCCRQPMTSCHDVMTWRHDVIVTCKTISGTNQHINLISQFISGFYCTGRSMGHFTTCCRQPMRSWRHDMTSWLIRNTQIVSCKTISGTNQHINLIPNLFQGFTAQVGQWATLQHVVVNPWGHDVMTWRHDVIVTCKTISGTNQHINLIPNLFQGFTTQVGHWATLQHVAVNPWRHDMTSWRHRDMQCYYRRYWT